MIHFDLPKEQSSIIKVIGIGGGGSNAVNYMFSQSIDGVNFIICNTDAQSISQSVVPNKIQLGPHLTQGLGAGANPEIGRQATEESLEEIKRILEVNTKMAFITVGMGGGTGTGGAPIIAK
ncbi:MAG: cell division protein FtsZ, partial [Chitinophagaceae bacterium]|nr:cell division protein FtsZ [Chitinophagaceae bacterium]